MTGVVAAVAGAAVIGAGATAYAGHEAANATKSATNSAIAAQQSAQQQQAALNAPYAAIGTGTGGQGGAIQQYQNLLGLGPQGQAGIQSTLANTPGYQFTQQQGIGATKNAASASGMALSGNTLEALDTFNSGLADSTYQQAVGNAQNAVTIGQNAAAGTGSGILQTGTNISNLISNQGNTLAGITANETAGLTKSLSGGANSLVTLNTLQGLTNPGGAGGAAPTYNPGPGDPGYGYAGG